MSTWSDACLLLYGVLSIYLCILLIIGRSKLIANLEACFATVVRTRFIQVDLGVLKSNFSTLLPGQPRQLVNERRGVLLTTHRPEFRSIPVLIVYRDGCFIVSEVRRDYFTILKDIDTHSEIFTSKIAAAKVFALNTSTYMLEANLPYSKGIQIQFDRIV